MLSHSRHGAGVNASKSIIIMTIVSAPKITNPSVVEDVVNGGDLPSEIVHFPLENVNYAVTLTYKGVKYVEFSVEPLAFYVIDSPESRKAVSGTAFYNVFDA